MIYPCQYLIHPSALKSVVAIALSPSHVVVGLSSVSCFFSNTSYTSRSRSISPSTCTWSSCTSIILRTSRNKGWSCGSEGTFMLTVSSWSNSSLNSVLRTFCLQAPLVLYSRKRRSFQHCPRPLNRTLHQAQVCSDSVNILVRVIQSMDDTIHILWL